jgi:Fe-Mn family superoxide dismutase
MAPTRRDFLLNSGKAGLGICIGSAWLASCSSAKKIIRNSTYTTGFQQLPLPYSFNALNEAIDGTTMEIHYSKHAAGYAANLQDAAKAENADTTKPLEDLLENISKYSTKMRNNAGGHWNHEQFWKMMKPDGEKRAAGKLATAMEESFGSFEAFKNQFSDAAKNRFGSGWAWLIVDGDKKLRVASTPNQDNPLMDVAEIKGFPVLGLDVWEHAYYLRYQNKRPDYITAWWNVVNWDYVQSRYNSAI